MLQYYRRYFRKATKIMRRRLTAARNGFLSIRCRWAMVRILRRRTKDHAWRPRILRLFGIKEREFCSVMEI
jgi:hypothetical protein